MYGTTAKFKSANIFISAARDQTVKFKDRQYFRLYGMYRLLSDIAKYQHVQNRFNLSECERK